MGKDSLIGLPRWPNGKESTCQDRRWKSHRFHPCVGKISWGGEYGNLLQLQYSCLDSPMDYPGLEEPGRLQSMGSFGQTQLRTHRASLMMMMMMIMMMMMMMMMIWLCCTQPGHWISKILTTGLPGNSLECVFRWKNWESYSSKVVESHQKIEAKFAPQFFLWSNVRQGLQLTHL